MELRGELELGCWSSLLGDIDEGCVNIDGVTSLELDRRRMAWHETRLHLSPTCTSNFISLLHLHYISPSVTTSYQRDAFSIAMHR